jgi:drug/metabolite transporter (DMT)-like permease
VVALGRHHGARRRVIAAAPRTHAHPLTGVLLILLAAAFFAAMDSTTRGLSQPDGPWAVPVLLIVTLRYTVQAVVMGLWLAPRGRAGFASAYPRFQWLRGLLLLATSCCSFFAVRFMPVPEYTAINMLTPLLVTVLAGIFLHEHVSPLRWALVFGGFAGALIVIRPGSGTFGWVVALPLVGAAAYASFQVLTSRLSGAENPMTTHFWTGFVGAIVLWPVLLVAAGSQGVDASLALLRRLPSSAWLLMAFIGLLGTTGHLALILALGKARTATLMPFQYSQIAFAALFGYLVFDRLPDGWAWAGMAVIAACGTASVALNLRRPGAGTPTAAADVLPE